MAEQKAHREQPKWTQPEGKPLTDLMIYNSLTKTKVPFVSKNGKSVTWYICGPTVYDASHMGHARNYLGFDIIKRILTEYFHYDVHIVMNITDIDDKIIVRAREQGIPFTELARKWEASFLEDLKQLKIQPPDVLTRVSEYVPEIVAYIQKIIDNGYAYESNGSVYFDVEAFSKKHYYAKLQPNSAFDATLVAEGEGSLSANIVNEKRSPFDFALWKKSKEGEPKWGSQWGEGRPGWHIECSAMASDILGHNIDIHAGGEDLRFPHHDNELAQSEAYYDNDQWVNYFIHSGHLHIEGRKMAKSLKNFITIQEGLEKYDGRKMRMLFLLHKYDDIMNYSLDAMIHAVDADKKFNEFFHQIKGILRKHKTSEDVLERWEQNDKDLNKSLMETKSEVHKSLADNFNTPNAMLALQTLVNKTNVYISTGTNPKAYLLRSVATYITSIFKVFGLIDTSEIGFPTSDSNAESTLGPVLDVFTNFRSDVRSSLKKKDLNAVFALTDKVRDDDLPPLGIRMSDLPDGSALWKLDDKDVLMKEVAQKREVLQKKLEEKERKLKEDQEKLEKGKLNPKDMFLGMKDKYSAFDEKGIPTLDHEGQPVKKSTLKTLQKEYQAQQKLHEKWLASQSSAESKSEEKK